MSCSLRWRELSTAHTLAYHSQHHTSRTFIVAGTGTTSTALARTLHLLCLHPDAQDKLRAELRQAHEQHGDMITYDELNKLTYLDAICRETLRL